MSDATLKTAVLRNMIKITDPKVLKQLAETLWKRMEELEQEKARITTASWKIGDEVMQIPEKRNSRPYGAKGKITKINSVTMGVKFGDENWKMHKSLLMLAK